MQTVAAASCHPITTSTTNRTPMPDLWHALTAPLAEPFLRHALIEVVVVGVVGGLLGCWIVLYGLSYSAESLSHGLFPGLVAAALLGLPLLAGGAVGVAVAAVSIAAVAGIRGLDRDTSVGVVITSVFGAGVLLALSPSSPPGLQELLFGDVLAVTSGDIAVTAMLAAIVVVALLVLHGRLLLVGFDRSTARALGIRPRPVDGALLLLVGVAVVTSVQALGSLLVVAVLVAPSASARIVTHRLPTMMLASVTIAVTGGVAGLYLSYYAGTAAGASIALCLVAAYLLALSADAALQGRRPPQPGDRPDSARAGRPRAGRSRSPVAR
jgi:ABC-type Mn2+/Zn2+ transport system permease subunit